MKKRSCYRVYFLVAACSFLLNGCSHTLSGEANLIVQNTTQEQAIATLEKYLAGTGVGEGICSKQKKIYEKVEEPFKGIHNNSIVYESYRLKNCESEFDETGYFTKCDVIPLDRIIELKNANVFIGRTAGPLFCDVDDGEIQLGIFESKLDVLFLTIPEKDLEKFLIALKVVNPNTKMINSY